MIFIGVENQKMRTNSTLEDIVEGSQEFVKFKFELSEDWDGLTVFAQFQQGNGAYEVYLDEDDCVYLPSEITTGDCDLMLYGTGGTVRATTNYLTFKINENRIVEGASSTQITQSLYDQLVSRVATMEQNINNKANASHTHTVANITGLSEALANAGSSIDPALLSGKLDKSGGTMTGALVMDADKYIELECKRADWRYVLHANNGQFWLHKLNKTGNAIMSRPIYVDADGVLSLNGANVQVGTDGKLTIGGKTITTDSNNNLYVNGTLVTGGTGGSGATITIDDALNASSTNPVQNKKIAEAFQEVDDAIMNIGSTYLDSIEGHGLFVARTADEMRNIHQHTDIAGNPETAVYNVLYLGEDTADGAFKKYRVYRDNGTSTESGRTPSWTAVADLQSTVTGGGANVGITTITDSDLGLSLITKPGVDNSDGSLELPEYLLYLGSDTTGTETHGVQKRLCKYDLLKLKSDSDNILFYNIECNLDFQNKNVSTLKTMVGYNSASEHIHYGDVEFNGSGYVLQNEQGEAQDEENDYPYLFGVANARLGDDAPCKMPLKDIFADSLCDMLRISILRDASDDYLRSTSSGAAASDQNIKVKWYDKDSQYLSESTAKYWRADSLGKTYGEALTTIADFKNYYNGCIYQGDSILQHFLDMYVKAPANAHYFELDFPYPNTKIKLSIYGLVDEHITHTHNVSDITDLKFPVKQSDNTWITDSNTVITDEYFNQAIAEISELLIQTNIVLDGKAEGDHTHSDYATKTELNGKADKSHTHTVDTALSSTSTNPVQNKAIYTELGKKVDKASGKGLSTNDYTTDERNKLSGIESGANKTVVDTSLSGTSNNPVANSVIKAEFDSVNTALGGKADSGHTHSEFSPTSHTHTAYTPDTALSSTSTKPIQNKVVTNALGDKADKVHEHTIANVTGLTEALQSIQSTEGNDNVFIFTAELDNINYVGNNVSHTFAEVKAQIDLGKEVLLKAIPPITILATEVYRLRTYSDSVITFFYQQDTRGCKVTYNSNSEMTWNTELNDSALSATSNNAVQNRTITNALNNKADISHTHTAADITDLPTTPNITIDSALSTTSENPVQNKVINTALAGKANSSHSHTLDEVSETTSKKIMTATERTKLSGIAEGANKTVVDNSMSSTSTNPVQNKVVNTALSNKVDKESGKGLSTNDYTTAEKTKLSGIAEGANKTTVDTALSTTSTNPVQNKIVKAALDSKSDSSHTHSNYATSDHTHSGYATTTALNNMLSKSGGTMTGALDMAANLNLANNKYLNFYMTNQNFRYTFHADESGKFYFHKLNADGTANRSPLRVQPNGDLELNHTTNNKVSVKSDGKLYINGAEVKSSPWFNVKDYGAVGDGATDDSVAIQDALYACRDAGGGTVYFPVGTYVMSTSALFYSNTHILFEKGATLTRLNNSCMTFLGAAIDSTKTGYTGTHDVIIEGGTFDGNINLVTTANINNKITMIIHHHAKNITLKDCTFKNGNTWHLYEMNSSQNVTVEDCIFDGSNYGGTYTSQDVYSELVQIDFDTATSTHITELGLSGDQTGCENVTFNRCKFISNNHAVAIGDHNSSAQGHRYIKIKNCHFSGGASNRGMVGFKDSVFDVDIYNNVFIGEGSTIAVKNGTANSRTKVFENRLSNVNAQQWAIGASASYANYINGTLQTATADEVIETIAYSNDYNSMTEFNKMIDGGLVSGYGSATLGKCGLYKRGKRVWGSISFQNPKSSNWAHLTIAGGDNRGLKNEYRPPNTMGLTGWAYISSSGIRYPLTGYITASGGMTFIFPSATTQYTEATFFFEYPLA